MNTLANVNDFIQNRIPDEGMPKEVITLTGYKKPLNVEIQGQTTEEQLHLIRQSTVTYPPANPGGESKEGLDLYSYTGKIIISAVKSVDFRSRDLQRAYEAADQIDLVYKMFNEDDRELIMQTILDLSQEAPTTDGTPEEDVQAAKN